MNRKLFKIILFIFILTLNLSIVYANENEEETHFSKVYEEWLELPKEEKENSIPPLPFNIRYQKKPNTSSSFTTKSKYDLKENINITVKNQEQTGLCWGFAANSMLETYLQLHGETLNFSERHLDYATAENYVNGINKNSIHRSVGDGGHNVLSAAYYAKGLGPILEENMPFINSEYSISIEELPENVAVKKVDDIIHFPTLYKSINNNGDIIYIDGNYSSYTLSEVNEIRNQIKEHIMTYGGIVTNIHAPEKDGYHNYSTSASYVPADSGVQSNHAVTIIGWDDNYSKDNFLIKPKSDGAYIALNSWGSTWGNGGLYYISYEDYYVEGHLMGTRGVSNIEYDKLYQYDDYTLSSSFYTRYAANVYTAEKNEILTEVMIGSIENQTFDIFYCNDADNLNYNNFVKIANSVSVHPGYNSVKINNINIQSGTKFAIIVEASDMSYSNIAIEADTNYYRLGNCTNPASCNPSESFHSYNGTDWQDLFDKYGDNNFRGNFVIKAYTKSVNNFLNVSQVNGQLYSNYWRTINLKINTSYQNNGKNVGITILKDGNNVTSNFEISGKIISGNGAFILINNNFYHELGNFVIKINVDGFSEVERTFQVISYSSKIYKTIEFNDTSLFKYIIKKVESVRTGQYCDDVVYRWDNENTISMSQEIFNNITEINADGESINDISGLQYLSKLEKISLNYNYIDSIAYLSNLQNLKELYIKGNDMTSISPLGTLNNLKILDLSENTCLTSLNGIPSSVKELYLCYISYDGIDISSIFNLTNLEKLDLSDNSWINESYFGNINNLSKLTYLALKSCNIKDIKFLKNINLQTLEIGNLHYYYYKEQNEITDFSPLYNKSSLTYLDITLLKNIDNLDWLANIPNINSFIYDFGNLNDASALDIGNLSTKNWNILSLQNHDYSVSVSASQNIVDLPPIFSQICNPNSKLYANGEIELNGCQWNEVGKSIMLLNNNIAYILVNDGVLKGSSYSIDIVVDLKEYLTDKGKEIFVKTSSNTNVLLLDSSDNLIKENFLENYFLDQEGVNIYVRDINSNVISNNGKIGSYTTIQLLGDDNFSSIGYFIVAVKGDVSGDGLVKIYDAFKILTNILSEYIYFDDIDILLMDFNKDGNVKMYDAFQYLLMSLQ